MIDEEGLFTLWLFAKGPSTIAMVEKESSIPKTTLYRKVRELEERGWMSSENGKYKLSERGRILLRMEAFKVIGAFYVESLYFKAVRLSVGDGWENAFKVLESCTESFVLTYETAAYLMTNFQTPSATFAYVLEDELGRIVRCSGGKRSEIANLVLIPVKELPRSEMIKGLPVVTTERLKLELLTWLGRGILDLAALGEKVPEVAEEMTDIITD